MIESSVDCSKHIDDAVDKITSFLEGKSNINTVFGIEQYMKLLPSRMPKNPIKISQLIINLEKSLTVLEKTRINLNTTELLEQKIEHDELLYQSYLQKRDVAREKANEKTAKAVQLRYETFRKGIPIPYYSSSISEHDKEIIKKCYRYINRRSTERPRFKYEVLIGLTTSKPHEVTTFLEKYKEVEKALLEALEAENEAKDLARICMKIKGIPVNSWRKKGFSIGSKNNPVSISRQLQMQFEGAIYDFHSLLNTLKFEIMRKLYDDEHKSDTRSINVCLDYIDKKRKYEEDISLAKETVIRAINILLANSPSSNC